VSERQPERLTLDVPAELTGFELHRLKLPLLEPFVASHGTVHERDLVLVQAIAGRAEGWAECSTFSAPTYVDESTGGAWVELSGDLGREVVSARGTTVELDLAGRRAAAAAIEVALLDLTGSWREWWPATASDRVASTAVVGQRRTVDEAVAAVERALAEGHRSVKVKIGPGWDVEPLAAIREAWPSLDLAADANGSYPADDLGALGWIDRYELRYLEQPFPARRLPAIAELRARLATPIALDESIVDGADLRDAIALGAGDIVNVKLSRIGGLRRAVDVAAQARQAGWSCFCGGMLECGVGRSVALRVAARPEFDLPTDLGPSSRYFVDDVTEPLGWAAAGLLAVPSDRGLARWPTSSRLLAATVDRVSIGR
jgi:O-succinylbenzoate synthase